MPQTDNAPSEGIVLDDPEPEVKGSNGRLFYLVVVVAAIAAAALLGGMWMRLHQNKVADAKQAQEAVGSEAAPSNRQSVEQSAGMSDHSSASAPAPTNSGKADSGNGDSDDETHPELGYSGPQAAQNQQEAAAEQQLQQEQQAAYQAAVQARETPTSYEAYLESQRGAYGSTQAPMQPQMPTMPDMSAASRPGDSPELAAIAHQLAGRDSGSGGNDPNGQQNKSRFISDQGELNPADDYLKATRVNPISKYEIQQDSVIPAVIPVGIDSDLPGQVTAYVRTDVNNSLCNVTLKDGTRECYVLIPAWSKLIGEYNANIAAGQNRVQVVWKRIIFPDTTSIDLDRWQAHSADGSAGLKGKVDNHWRDKIGGIALTSLLSAGLQISQSRGNNGNVFSYPSTGQIAANSIGQSLSQAGQEITRQNFARQPTIKILQGQKFVIPVKKDIVFSGPYESRY